jgi:carbamate kinase
VKAEKLTLFALGGNQVSPPGEFDPETGSFHSPDIGAQWCQAAKTCELLADIIEAHPERSFVLAHGNGPQVGNVLLRSEFAKPILHPVPLDVCGADTQGAMGYMLAQLGNALRTRGIEKGVAEIITQVVVDHGDPEFQNPSKFIGPSYSKKEAEQRKSEGIQFRFYKKDDEGREIWRRVVPSPKPLDVVEISMIEAMLATGAIPIAVGGGGIPVVEVPGEVVGDKESYPCRHGITYWRSHVEGAPPCRVYSGREAVIDKDLATSLLGIKLRERALKRGVDLDVELLILTDVDCVKLNFQTAEEKDLRHLTLAEAEELYASGIFPKGSIGPKVKAAIEFLKGGGKRVMITRGHLYEDTLAGKAGTTIER